MSRSLPRVIARIGLLALIGLVVATSGAFSGVTTRVNLASDGTQVHGYSAEARISADGRFVAFFSTASTLVAGGTNGAANVFVHELDTGTTERVSVSYTGSESDGGSTWPAISADGRYVAFESDVPSLVHGDGNYLPDIFSRDRLTGDTVIVSMGASGESGNGPSFAPTMSGDGRYIAFFSYASNLVQGDTNSTGDGFVWDREGCEVRLVSVASDGTQGDLDCWPPVISADGRYVAFTSESTNLVTGDTNRQANEPPWIMGFDVFVHDLATGTTGRVSVSSDGTQANGDSGWSSISADGRYVAFESTASNLVPGDTNGARDIFVHDRTTGETTRVSVASDGNQARGYSGSPAISADGRYIAFDSGATNLVPGDTNGAADVFVRDRHMGVTWRVSLDSEDGEGNGESCCPAVSADGRRIAFRSGATNLVLGDTNGSPDIFVRDLGPSNSPPVITSLNAPADPMPARTIIHVAGTFTDPDASDRHTATWDWGDSTMSGPVDLDPSSREAIGSHTYVDAGVYTIHLTITDQAGESDSSVSGYVVIYDPEGGFVTGGGWIDSPVRAYAADPELTGKASFGFVSRYKKGADIPTGQTQFQFKVADLNFHSTSYQWLVIAGPQAKFKGVGTINGTGEYGFMLTAVDEALTSSTDVDLFRIKIWNKVTDEVVYDNQMGAVDDADATTEIGGGSIVIHKK